MVRLTKLHKRAIVITIIALLNILILLNLNYKCPWRESLHIYCAGCGGTRMLRAILNLDFYQAFRYNPLLFLLIIISLIYIIYVIICTIKHIKYQKITQNHLLILLFITIIFMIMRNTQPFSFLLPTKI